MTMQKKEVLLFTSWKMRELQIKNRIMISPMCTYQAKSDGKAREIHFSHYAQFSLGGAGLVMVEATAVEAAGRISAWDLGIWSDEQIKPLSQVVNFAHEQGSKAGLQLAHAGLKGSTKTPWDGNSFLDESDAEKGSEPWQTVGPSPDLLPADWPAPKVLTTMEIKDIVSKWGEAAMRADKAGFDVLEIHGAHGYLISEFLSPLSNSRNDQYGGEKGRMRLAIEVAEAVRANWPQTKPLFFRLSVIDGIDVGWSVENSIELAKDLKRIGVDLIDCSSGGFNVARDKSIPRNFCFQTYLADAVKSRAEVSVSAVGLITEPEQAETILQKSQADLIAIGRAALFNPYWARHAAQFFGIDEKFERWSPQYGWWLARWKRTLNHLKDTS